jgi:hypothetical protein
LYILALNYNVLLYIYIMPGLNLDKYHLTYYIGITIVILSNLYILTYGLPQNQIRIHVLGNLLAAGMIAYSWFYFEGLNDKYNEAKK